MNYTLHQLQVFLKITQTKSITKAAEELHLTQPAVSIQLKNLQDQFEIPLTEVVGRQLYITEFGKEIAIAAQNISNEVYGINYKTLAFKGILSGKLKISVVSTGKYVMPYFLSDFTNKNKGIELEMDVTNRGNVIKSLKKNEVDFALVSTLPNDIEVHSEVILTNKLFLVTNTKNKEENIKKVNDYIAKSALIYREEGSATRIAMENYLKNEGLQAKMKLKLTSNEAVKQAVIAGLGLSIMPLIGLKNELENESIKIIPAKNLPIITNWTLIWLKGKKLSPTATAFLDFIRQEKANISEEHFSWINSY
ncbi:LysR family transcriptional regulator [Flavobacterium sp.]|uniref:LysR family transcriptional regulator n=1 Tax=Flavobacterium sp. TaxID=239 RepID=UPI002615485F|nr:LysR family transcriptional regulator [Flavobacterium sp.]